VDVRVLLSLLLQVHERDRDVISPGPAALYPEVVRAAHVEDAKRPRQACGEALEPLESA
jgi:hypothetical protein